MSDLIDRRAAIDGFYEMASDIDHLCTVGDYILFLESLSAQRWISVAEGLPGKYEYVLLTCERNCNLVVDFGCLSPDIDGNLSWWIASHDLIEGWRVLAWMSLPEPYKEEEDGTLD